MSLLQLQIKTDEEIFLENISTYSLKILDFNINAYNYLMFQTWKHSTLTPEEVMEVLGDKAIELFSLGDALKNAILSALPDIETVPTNQLPTNSQFIYLPPTNYTIIFNQDQTVSLELIT